ncbi:hypothetical protein [Rhizohabitans arisaemae]|nr:hypothetical protein [Rhizohabitans arisaemae]
MGGTTIPVREFAQPGLTCLGVIVAATRSRWLNSPGWMSGH